MPIMITETSANRRYRRPRAQWMDETLDTVRALRVRRVSRSLAIPGFRSSPWWIGHIGKADVRSTRYLIHLGCMILLSTRRAFCAVTKPRSSNVTKTHGAAHAANLYSLTPRTPIPEPPCLSRTRLSLDGQWYFSPTEIRES